MPRSVLARAIFRNARADQRADQPAGGAARARAGQGRRDRTGDDQPEARNRNRGANREHRGQRGADAAANRRALAHTLGGLGAAAQFGAGLHVTEMLDAGVVGHQHADVIGLIAVLRGQALVGTAGRFRRVETGDVASAVDRGATHAVGLIHDVVGSLAGATSRVLTLALGFHALVAGDVSDHIFRRAFGALTECRDFFAECVVVSATSFQGNLFSM